MKLKHFLLLLALAALAASCKVNGPDLGIPTLRINKYSFVAPKVASKDTVKIFSNRPWNTVCSDEWIAVNPKSGEAAADSQIVVITLLDNSLDSASLNRTGTISFETGFTNRIFTVFQEGNIDPEELIRYANDFDAEDAQSSGTSWPMLDKTDCWKNEHGQGTDDVDYESKNVSARTNSSSSGSYSDYEGSGHNNFFFGTGNAYFMVKKIALGGNKNLKLSFGSEKYLNTAPTAPFTNAEFPVYLSKDGVLWVTYTEYVFAGTAAGRWNLASGTIEIPADADTLYMCFQPTVASAYRLDDLKLEAVSETGATFIDFSKGVKKDFSGGDVEVKEVTLAQFIAAPVSTTVKYKFTAEIAELVPSTNSVNVYEGTTQVQLFQLSNYSDYSASMAKGDMITATGYRGLYNTLIEMKDGTINSVKKAGEEDIHGAWAHTLASGDLAQGDVVLSQLKWNVNVVTTGTPTFSWNASFGVQIGARSNYASSTTMKTSKYADPVNKVVVNTTNGAASKTASLNVTVNGVDYGTKSLGATSANLEFTPSGEAATGEIVLTWTISTSSAFYIKSLSVNPTE